MGIEVIDGKSKKFDENFIKLDLSNVLEGSLIMELQKQIYEEIINIKIFDKLNLVGIVKLYNGKEFPFVKGKIIKRIWIGDIKKFIDITYDKKNKNLKATFILEDDTFFADTILNNDINLSN